MSRAQILSLIFSALIAGGAVGGYRVFEDNSASVFEHSVHAVVSVIDGDTIGIENDVRIRLLGINAPDRTECFYEESKLFLRELLEDGVITIRKDISGADRHGRLLRYVLVPSDTPEEDDVFVQERMVREGYAKTFAVAPNNEFRDLLSSAQQEAREKGRGLWGACEVEPESSLRERDSLPIDPSCTIKGNISEKGYGKQYFPEGCPNYNRIKVDVRKGEAYFCTEEDAIAAGFTRSASCDNTF